RSARLRVDAVRLDVLAQRDRLQCPRVWIAVREVRALAGIRIGENHLGANLLRGTNRFHKGIGGLDWNVDRLIGLVLIAGGVSRARTRARHRVVIENDGNLWQPLDRIEIRLLQRLRQFDSDDGGPLLKNSAAHLNGKFQAARDDRQIGESSALETREFRKRLVRGGHTVSLPRPAFRAAPSRALLSRVRVRWRGS